MSHSRDDDPQSSSPPQQKKHFLRQTTFHLSLLFCEGEVIVQGDEGPVCGVAQVVDCHGVTVGHQEREEEEEQQEVEGEGENTQRTTTHVHGWDEGEKTSASGLEPCGVMND